MKKTRFLLSVILIAAIVSGVFSACGKAQETTVSELLGSAVADSVRCRIGDDGQYSALTDRQKEAVKTLLSLKASEKMEAEAEPILDENSVYLEFSDKGLTIVAFSDSVLVTERRDEEKGKSGVYALMGDFDFAAFSRAFSAEESARYTLSVWGGDKNCQASIVSAFGNEFAAGDRVELLPTFSEGYELAYWFTSEGVKVENEGGKYFLIMAAADSFARPKSQKIGEAREKKQYRFTISVVRGSLSDNNEIEDFYNAGDKIAFAPVPNSTIKNPSVRWSSSDGEAYDYENFVMPAHDVALTATFTEAKTDPNTFYLEVKITFPAGKTIDGYYVAGARIELPTPRIPINERFVRWETTAGTLENAESLSNAVFIMPQGDATLSVVTKKA